MTAYDEKILIDFHLIVKATQKIKEEMLQKTTLAVPLEIRQLSDLDIAHIRRLHNFFGNQFLLREYYPLLNTVKKTVQSLASPKSLVILRHINDVEKHPLWPTVHDEQKTAVMRLGWQQRFGTKLKTEAERISSWNKFCQTLSTHLHQNQQFPSHSYNYFLLPEKQLKEYSSLIRI